MKKSAELIENKGVGRIVFSARSFALFCRIVQRNDVKRPILAEFCKERRMRRRARGRALRKVVASPHHLLAQKLANVNRYFWVTIRKEGRRPDVRLRRTWGIRQRIPVYIVGHPKRALNNRMHPAYYSGAAATAISRAHDRC